MHHKCGQNNNNNNNINSNNSNVSSMDVKSESDESLPLNLTATDGKLMKSFIKKFNETQARSLMMPMPQINFIQSDLPEQTEPEDLTMHSPRSPVSMDELEELEDAATLYMKLKKNKSL
jgi:hypothetical protein